MISKKIYNDEYAPGIATYGINGKTVWKCLYRR